jgi:hypothetical protein
MKRRVRPVQHTSYVAVLYRIEVNVVDVAFKIGIIANGMLPISPLPKRQFSVWMACDFDPASCNGHGETPFNQAESDGKVCIPRWQCHYDVQVIRQNHDRINGERVFAPRDLKAERNNAM